MQQWQNSLFQVSHSGGGTVRETASKPSHLSPSVETNSCISVLTQNQQRNIQRGLQPLQRPHLVQRGVAKIWQSGDSSSILLRGAKVGVSLLSQHERLLCTGPCGEMWDMTLPRFSGRLPKEPSLYRVVEVKTHPAGEGRGEWEAEEGGMKPSILEGAHSQELTSSPELHIEKLRPLPLDCSMWTLHHRRMLESLGRVLVSFLEGERSCSVSELYLQGWYPAPQAQFKCPPPL